MIPVTPDDAVAAERAVDGPRDADCEAAKTAAEGPRVVGFDDEMDVIVPEH